MIVGAHSIIYSRDPEADRAFFRDVLRFPAVDVGDGWLIFGLPPSEVAFHPGRNNLQELYLLCDDIQDFLTRMQKLAVKCGKVRRQPWGLLTTVSLPGGGRVGVYEPLHKRPKSPRRAAASTRARKPLPSSHRRNATSR